MMGLFRRKRADQYQVHEYMMPGNMAERILAGKAPLTDLEEELAEALKRASDAERKYSELVVRIEARRDPYAMRRDVHMLVDEEEIQAAKSNPDFADKLIVRFMKELGLW